MKQCRTCKIFKEEIEFYNRGGIRKGKPRKGIDTECKICFRLRSKKNSSKESRRFNMVKFKYGLSKEEYINLLKQYPVCGICKNSFKENEPCVDHNHTTNQVRGLLCFDCNIGIGRLKDNQTILYNAIEYLNKFKLGC